VFWWGNVKERHYLEEPDVNDRMIYNGIPESGISGHKLNLAG
jgi:hypothetical protein